MRSGPRTIAVGFRATELEIGVWDSVAEADGRSRSDWIRRTLNAASGLDAEPTAAFDIAAAADSLSPPEDPRPAVGGRQ